MAGRDAAIVRNPLLALPCAEQFCALPPEAKAALLSMLLDLQADARQRAAEAWKRNKGPMAVYWKAVGVYAGHLAKMCRVATITGAQP